MAPDTISPRCGLERDLNHEGHRDGEGSVGEWAPSPRKNPSAPMNLPCRQATRRMRWPTPDGDGGTAGGVAGSAVNVKTPKRLSVVTGSSALRRTDHALPVPSPRFDRDGNVSDLLLTGASARSSAERTSSVVRCLGRLVSMRSVSCRIEADVAEPTDVVLSVSIATVPCSPPNRASLRWTARRCQLGNSSMITGQGFTSSTGSVPAGSWSATKRPQPEPARWHRSAMWIACAISEPLLRVRSPDGVRARPVPGPAGQRPRTGGFELGGFNASPTSPVSSRPTDGAVSTLLAREGRVSRLRTPRHRAAARV